MTTPESERTKHFVKNVLRLWRHLSPRRHLQMFLLLGLSLCASMAEVLAIGAILPFIAVLISPEQVFESPHAAPVIRVFGFQDPTDLIVPLCVSFGVAAIVSGATRLLLLWAKTRLAQAIGADLSIHVYRRTLFQPYRVHVEQNSSEIIVAIAKAKGLVPEILVPLFGTISSLLLMGSILSFLILVDPTISLSVFSGFGAIYFLVAVSARKRLEANGKIMARESVKWTKTVFEGLGGIRDILLDGSQETYCEIYRTIDRRLNKASADNSFISGSPRFAIEALGLVLMTGFAYVVSWEEGGLVAILPLMGSLALGAQRILPALQDFYTSWATMSSGKTNLADVLSYLDQQLPDYAYLPPPKPLAFSSAISLRDVCFKYDQAGPVVLNNISFEIERGARVGIVGVTGSGKSTLLDIIMALLRPDSGSILIDGSPLGNENVRSWQANIAHVPQSIYLADSDIEQNIAFGVHPDKVDRKRVRLAAQRAQIADHIEGLREGYHSFVGERGIKLSGGQRQRIGIARALYKNANVIVFDEATSALDTETEAAVMDAIENLDRNLTILTIAHRLSTVEKCDKIVEIREGRVARVGKYEDLFAPPHAGKT